MLFLVISQVIYVLLIAVWFFIWLRSFMMFDNGIGWANSIAFGLLSAYPVAVVVSSIAAWVLHRKGKRRPSILVNLIPGIWVVGLAGVLGFNL